MVTAQPVADIYWDDANRADTVINFGVTLQGFPTFRTFTVHNKGTREVTVPTQLDPFFSIVNVPGVPAEDPRKEEYAPVDRFPFTIPAGETRSFQITFRAIANNPQYPPDIINEALLNLRIVETDNQQGPFLSKRFRLLALKTTRILASNRPFLAFDSVYVSPRPLPPVEQYRLSNVIDNPVRISAQRIRMITPVLTGSPEFSVQVYPDFDFPGHNNVDWDISYTPLDRGRDSGVFTVVYRPDPTSGIDSVVGTMSGVGVEQKIRIVSAQGLPTPVQIRNDTIDFGNVPADGSGVEAIIVLMNDGNLNISVDGEEKRGSTARDTAAYKVSKKLADQGPLFRTNAIDTVRIRFVPTDAGTHRMKYVIMTDLLRRSIRGVPDGTQDIVINCTGFGQRPQLQPSPSEIDFGTVVLLPSCTSTSERALTIINVGNADLRVDSLRVEPATEDVQIDRSSFVIPPGGRETVHLTYSATVLGKPRTGSLTFVSNALTGQVRIPFRVDVVRPDTIAVAMPGVVRSKPGTAIFVPVSVDADRIALASRANLRITYDPTLLRYNGRVTTSTATDGAQFINEGEDPRGSLLLDIRGNGNFTSKNTLIILRFDTFLGASAATEIAMRDATVTFGNDGCPSVLDVRATSGRYEIDSVCGLEFKTVGSGAALFTMGAFPNPAREETTVTLMVRDTHTIAMRLVDAYGRIVRTFADRVFNEGTHVIGCDLRGLSAGAYIIEADNGRLVAITPVMVTQ